MKEILYKHRKQSILLVLLMVIGNIIMVINYFFNLKMTDAIINRNMNEFIRLLFIVLIIMTIKSLQGYIYGIKESKIVKKVGIDLRKDITDSFLHYDYEKYYKNDSGSYVSMFTNDTELILKEGVIQYYQMINEILAVIFSLFGAALIHWSFLIIFPISLAIVMVTPKKLGPEMKKAYQSYSKANGIFVGKVKNIMLGFGIFLSENRLEEIGNKIHEFTYSFEENKYSYNKTIYRSNTIINTVAVFANMLYIIGTGYLVVRGTISPGSVIGLMNLAGMFFPNAQSAISRKVSIDSAESIYSNIIKEVKSMEENNKEKKISISSLDSAIDVKDIYYSYDGKDELFNGLSTRFEKGKKYAIIADSGKGKSTFLNILSGNLCGFKGQIFYDKADLRKIDKKSLRNITAYIDQNTYILNESIRYNITIGRDISDEKLYEILKKVSLLDFVQSKTEGLDYKLTENGKNLSGGQRQRIAIARALIGEKEILFIDEGTSELDFKTSKAIENSILSNPNLTVLMVSHHITENLTKKLDKFIKIA